MVESFGPILYGSTVEGDQVTFSAWKTVKGQAIKLGEKVVPLVHESGFCYRALKRSIRTMYTPQEFNEKVLCGGYLSTLAKYYTGIEPSRTDFDAWIEEQRKKNHKGEIACSRP